jgi:tRNA (Thr-GGU) A37 N-methylase
MLDGTPLLEIKPYVGRYDAREGVRSGWLDEIDEGTARERGRRGYRGARADDRAGI